MRDLPIAYGNSCYAKTWANKTTTWEDLCERLKTTIRTTESVEEYPKLKKDDRDRAKDKGGFVGGNLKGNRRKRETVACRSMLTMDADHAEIGFIDKFTAECRYTSCLYTTHGHTPEHARRHHRAADEGHHSGRVRSSCQILRRRLGHRPV